MWSVWRGWCDVLPFGDGLGGVNGGRPQARARWGNGQCRERVVFVSEPCGVGVGNVGWERAGGHDPHLGDGVVNMAGEFHFFHQLLREGVATSWVSASASTVMVQVPSGSVTHAVSGRPRWVAQAASWLRASVRASSMVVAVRVRLMPARVMVPVASVSMWALAGGQVCTGLSFRGSSGWDVQVAMHILCEGRRLCERGR